MKEKKKKNEKSHPRREIMPVYIACGRLDFPQQLAAITKLSRHSKKGIAQGGKYWAQATTRGAIALWIGRLDCGLLSFAQQGKKKRARGREATGQRTRYECTQP